MHINSKKCSNSDKQSRITPKGNKNLRAFYYSLINKSFNKDTINR